MRNLCGRAAPATGPARQNQRRRDGGERPARAEAQDPAGRAASERPAQLRGPLPVGWGYGGRGWGLDPPDRFPPGGWGYSHADQHMDGLRTQPPPPGTSMGSCRRLNREVVTGLPGWEHQPRLVSRGQPEGTAPASPTAPHHGSARPSYPASLELSILAQMRSVSTGSSRGFVELTCSARLSQGAPVSVARPSMARPAWRAK